LSQQSEFASLARDGGRGALVTVLQGPGAGGKLLVRADGSSEGSLGNGLDEVALRHAEELMWDERSEAREEGEALLFVDVVHPAPRLIVFGAVDFASALVTLARTIGWRPYIVDPRSRFATPERFPDAEEIVVGWPEEAFARLGGIDRATSIVVLTHDPKLDDAALTIALRSDAAFVGAMGSRRAQASRRERLLALGMTDAELDRLAAPVGLDLGAMSSEETALSILSEVVAMRHGREGGRLSQVKGGRIHEVGA
jgi:xanthine dehydrogenase accessory factor